MQLRKSTMSLNSGMRPDSGATTDRWHAALVYILCAATATVVFMDACEAPGMVEMIDNFAFMALLTLAAIL